MKLRMGGGFDNWILLGAGIWLVLQVAALVAFRGGWRVAAWVSAIAMGAALVVALLGVLAGSNLAPIWVVLALPLCLGWVVLVWIARGVWWAVSTERS